MKSGDTGQRPSSRSCRALRDRVVAALRGLDGAVYGVSEDSCLETMVAPDVLTEAEPRLFEQWAAAALRSRRTVVGRVEADWFSVDGARADSYFATPLVTEDGIVGVAVVIGIRAEGLSIEDCLRQVGDVPDLLAASVERRRILGAVDARERQIDGLRRQLDAYAVDFRSTYAAERDRTRQLADALAQLQRTYTATVQSLAMAVEAKDEYTGGHIQRVSRYGMLLTAAIAPDHSNDPQFEYGFLLHDIGKLAVPDVVLRNPDPLSEAQWELMRAHPDSGRSILDGIPFLEGARQIVFSHHERWDGAGYPLGLRGEAIPLGGRIFSVCDAFDAMTTDRPYRKALPVDTARREIEKGSGTQFWPDAVAAFADLAPDAIRAVMNASSRERL
jgi:cyclic di-GMP phosphodiesterase